MAFIRTTIYTPAVTMVAAWIKALTGVGPSMASGSQTYSGICADFPAAPTNSNSAIAVRTGAPTARAWAPSAASKACRIPKFAATSASPAEVKRMVPNVTAVSKMPRMNPESPMRFTINAFLPASEADFFKK